MIKSILCMVFIIILNGCAMRNDVQRLANRIVALEKRNLELYQETTRVKKEKAQIEAQLTNYSKSLEEKDLSLRSQSAGLRAASDRIRNEIQALNGKMEEIDFRLRQRLTKIDADQKNCAQKIAQIEQRFASNVPQNSGLTTSRKKHSEKDLYEFAKYSFDQGDYSSAAQGFKRLMAEYPKARYTDSALFWMGEIYYRQKKYENAILEYQKVIEKYPRGNKFKASLLKQGFAFANMGDKANAGIILKELVQAYPNSSEAKLARKKLKEF